MASRIERNLGGLLAPVSGRLVFADTETTGFDPKKERIVEIGLVEVVDMRITGNTFHTYINPEQRVHPDAERVHGLSFQFLSDKPLFADVSAEMLDFIGSDPLFAHNAPFDLSHIQGELRRARLPPIPPNARVIDTIQLFKQLLATTQLSLDAVCKRLKVSTANRTLHGALKDADLLAQAYIAGFDGNSGFLDGLMAPAAASPDAGQLSADIKVVRPPRNLGKPSEIELLAHARFVTATLQKPIWQLSGGDQQ